MLQKVTLFGPDVGGNPSKAAYGGGTGGYTRNVLTLVNYFHSSSLEIVHCPHTYRGQLKRDNFAWRMVVDTQVFIRHLLIHNPKLVHVLAQYRSALPREIMAVMVSKVAGVPVLYEVKAGALISSYKDGSFFYRFLVRRLLRAVDKVLCEGRVYVDFIKNEFGVSAEYFPNVVPDDMVYHRCCSLLSSSALRVLYVGFCTVNKGVLDLVEACEMAASRGVEIELTLIGAEDAQCMQWLNERSTHPNLELVRHGVQEHDAVLSAFKASDVYCYPTSHPGEGHNNSINEALALGLYVITSRAGFLADIITPDRGSSLSVIKPEAILEELICIDRDRVSAREKARRGQAHLIENYLTSKNFSRLEDIYLQLTYQS